MKTIIEQLKSICSLIDISHCEYVTILLRYTHGCEQYLSIFKDKKIRWSEHMLDNGITEIDIGNPIFIRKLQSILDWNDIDEFSKILDNQLFEMEENTLREI